MERDEIARLVEIDFFIIWGGTGLWSSLLSGCSGLVNSCVRFDEFYMSLGIAFLLCCSQYS